MPMYNAMQKQVTSNASPAEGKEVAKNTTITAIPKAAIVFRCACFCFITQLLGFYQRK